jgi:outer membrane receptor for Fe3+-dicitrate
MPNRSLRMKWFPPGLVTISVVSASVAPLAPAAVDAEGIADAGDNPLEVVTITGTRDEARQLPGSAYVVDAKDLEIFMHSNINQILAIVLIGLLPVILMTRGITRENRR